MIIYVDTEKDITQYDILNLTENWKKYSNNNVYPAAALMDLLKAFDTTNHDFLIAGLWHGRKLTHRSPPRATPTFSDIFQNFQTISDNFRHFPTVLKITFLGLLKDKYLQLIPKNSHKAGDQLDLQYLTCSRSWNTTILKFFFRSIEGKILTVNP